MPRKFNIAVSGSRDDFSHTHINDIGLQPCRHAVTGEKPILPEPLAEAEAEA